MSGWTRSTASAWSRTCVAHDSLVYATWHMYRAMRPPRPAPVALPASARTRGTAMVSPGEDMRSRASRCTRAALLIGHLLPQPTPVRVVSNGKGAAGRGDGDDEEVAFALDGDLSDCRLCDHR